MSDRLLNALAVGHVVNAKRKNFNDRAVAGQMEDLLRNRLSEAQEKIEVLTKENRRLSQRLSDEVDTLNKIRGANKQTIDLIGSPEGQQSSAISKKIQLVVKPWKFTKNNIKDKRIIALKLIAWTEYWLTITKEGYKNIQYNVDLLMDELAQAESTLSLRVLEPSNVQSLRLNMESAKINGGQIINTSRMALEGYSDPAVWTNRRVHKLLGMVSYDDEMSFIPKEDSFKDFLGNPRNVLQRKSEEKIDVDWLLEQLEG